MWRDIPWVGRARYILFFFAIGPCPPPAYFDGRITCILLRQGREPPPCGLGGGWLTERERCWTDKAAASTHYRGRRPKLLRRKSTTRVRSNTAAAGGASFKERGLPAPAVTPRPPRFPSFRGQKGPGRSTRWPEHHPLDLTYLSTGPGATGACPHGGTVEQAFSPLPGRNVPLEVRASVALACAYKRVCKPMRALAGQNVKNVKNRKGPAET